MRGEGDGEMGRWRGRVHEGGWEGLEGIRRGEVKGEMCIFDNLAFGVGLYHMKEGRRCALCMCH
jgi:hypothetical protein